MPLLLGMTRTEAALPSFCHKSHTSFTGTESYRLRPHLLYWDSQAQRAHFNWKVLCFFNIFI